MKHILLPDNRPRRLVFYLAMEEYVARCLDEKECFFMWQVTPTVIFGRNQVLEAEVNLPYCQENNITLDREFSDKISGKTFDRKEYQETYYIKTLSYNLQSRQSFKALLCTFRKKKKKRGKQN